MVKKITMQDIADRAGVSKVTVSKALADKDGVGDVVKEKIKLLADEMGYRYNASASAMKSGLSNNVGVIIPEHFTGGFQSFYLTVYQMLTKSLDEYRYASILHLLSSEDEEKMILPRTYFDRKVDAYIMLGQVSKEYVEQLNKSEVPVLFLDFYEEHTEMDSINTDNFYGAYGITNFLIQSGHEKIAFIGSIHATSSIQDRYLGYYKSLLEHNIILKPEYVIDDRDEYGLLKSPIELPEDMPTAFVCNNDELAYNLIEQLTESGYEVPKDISVVGYDNNIYSTLSKPQITTVDVNVAEMTTTAARIILDKIDNPEKSYGRIMIKGSIVYRDSVKKV